MPLRLMIQRFKEAEQPLPSGLLSQVIKLQEREDSPLCHRITMKLISILLAVAWCLAFPTAFFVVWALNLSVGEALPLLSATSALGLIAGIIHERFA